MVNNYKVAALYFCGLDFITFCVLWFLSYWPHNKRHLRMMTFSSGRKTKSVFSVQSVDP